MKKLAIVGFVFVGLVLGVALWLGGTAQFIEQATAQESVQIPFLEEWSGSAHADLEAEAFVHWNEDDPAEIPAECAKCHSTPGYLDHLGADGSTPGQVDAAAEIGTVVECVACHNEATQAKTSVVMPSGIELTDLGAEARCMECHQGRESLISVTEVISTAGVAEDTVSEDLSFLNIHYYAAAATKYGTLAKGGFEYEGQTYDGNFAHVEEFDTCIECHDSHTLEVKVEACSECHTDVSTVEDLRNVRMQGSLVDYDGDGDMEEGIAAELTGLQEVLYQAMQDYSAEVAGEAIAYSVTAYPYFFVDSDGDGEASEAEAEFANRFVSWTPRLVKAAYNYQTSLKDPGAYAHGGKYIMQLLHDSIVDLNSAISTPVEMADAHRIDHGHFAGSEEAFRHWDEDGEVPATCSKCHSAGGLPTFLKNDATIAEPISNGLQCSTCHNDLTEFSIFEVTEVEFPSGEAVESSNGPMGLCLQCHQGRTSKVTVDNAIEGLDDDVVSEDLGFVNIHYFAAGATLFGTEAKGAYEYDDQEYIGQFDHVNAADTCTDCHSTHELTVEVEGCAECHDGVETKEDLRTIREAEDDFDGDGNVTEGLAEEIDTMRDTLYTALQAYGTEVAETGIVYNPQRHPYFFIDANGDGEVDAGDTERFNAWTPRLLRAAYNYQYSTKDPGAYTHNGLYIIQVLYDTLEDIGQEVTVDTEDMVRP